MEGPQICTNLFKFLFACVCVESFLSQQCIFCPKYAIISAEYFGVSYEEEKYLEFNPLSCGKQ